VSPIKFSGNNLMNIFMIAVSGGVIIAANNWPLKTALFPMILGISGAILAIAELLVSLFGAEEDAKKRAAVDFNPSGHADKALASRRTLSISLWIILFSLLIFFLGLPIAVPLFVFSYLKFQGKEGWGITIVMTLSCWLFFYGLFVRLLHTSFEEGYLLTVLNQLTGGN
jgi:hypothetical protein